MTLKDIYVEARTRVHRMFAQLIGAATFHLSNGEGLEVIIIFTYTDLGATSTAQVRAREAIEDLGVRIEVIQ